MFKLRGESGKVNNILFCPPQTTFYSAPHKR